MPTVGMNGNLAIKETYYPSKRDLFRQKRPVKAGTCRLQWKNRPRGRWFRAPNDAGNCVFPSGRHTPRTGSLIYMMNYS